MFCVQKFTFDMLPVFTEDMIIKHSLMKSALWGNSFSVICVNLRISLGNRFWSIFSREGSFLCASWTILPPRAPYSRVRVSFQFDECKFHTRFKFPWPCFHFDEATAPHFMSPGKTPFWVAIVRAVKWGEWRTLLGAFLFFRHPELTVSTQAFQPEAVKRGLWATLSPQTCLAWPTIYMEFCQHFLNQQISAKNSE